MAWLTKFARLFVVMMLVALPAALLGCGSSSTPIVPTCDGGICTDAPSEGGPAKLISIQVTPAAKTVMGGMTAQFTATANFSDGSTKDVTKTATWSSSDTTIATVDKSGLATALKKAGTTTITATDMGKSGSGALTVTTMGLKSIQITPMPTASVKVMTTLQFTATGILTDGSTMDLTSTATWASSMASIATIDAKGLATGVAAGMTNITAKSGAITSNTVALTVTMPTVTGVVVTPATASTFVTGTVPFTATATFSDLSTADVTTTAAWTSSMASVATVGAATGVATGVAKGTAMITATFMGKSGMATLTVSSALCKSVAVTPATPTVAVGLTQQFTATCTLTDTTTQDVTSIAAWTSSSIPTATISATGLAKAVSVTPPTTTITATVTLGTVGGSPVSGTATMTVGAAKVASITVTPNPATGFAGGATVPFTATALFTDGTSANVTTSAAWTSGTPAVATIGAATGVATPLFMGTTTITATFNGVSGSSSLVVTTGVSVTGIVVTPAAPSIANGSTQQFTATATFSDGTTANVSSSASWTSGTPGTATISATGLATSVAVGTTTITATYTAGGVTKSGTATLTVTMATLTSITIAPNTLTNVPIGTSVTFVATGHFSDGTTQNITGTVTWTATPGAPPGAVVFTGASAQGTVAGDVTVTATQAGITSAGTPVVVTAATLVSIAVTPNPSTLLHIGQTEQFTATGTFSDGTTQNLTATANWTSSVAADASIATGGVTPGLASGLAAGTTNITATVGAIVSPAVPLTVNGSALTSIVVTPASKSLGVGQTQQFTATGHYADGTTGDITSTVSWTSAVPTFFSVSATGLVSAIAPHAAANLTATQGAISGTASVTVTAAVVTSVAVKCTSPNVQSPSTLTCIPSAVGFNVSCTALATLSDSTTQDVTATAAWASDTTSVATPGAPGSPQLFGIVGNGTANLTATSGGVTSGKVAVGGATEAIDAAPAAPLCAGGGGVEVFFVNGATNQCSPGTLGLGQTTQFHAAAAYKGGACGDGFFDVTAAALGTVWSSSSAHATVTGGGSVNAFSAGTATISAAYTPPATATTTTGTFALTVGSACITSMTLTLQNSIGAPTTPKVPADVNVGLTVIANFSSGPAMVLNPGASPGSLGTWSSAAVSTSPTAAPSEWILDTSSFAGGALTFTLAAGNGGCGGAAVAVTDTVTIDATLPSGLAFGAPNTGAALILGGSGDLTAFATYPGGYGAPFAVSQQNVCAAPPCWTTNPAATTGTVILGFSPDTTSTTLSELVTESCTTKPCTTGYAGTVTFVYRNQSATEAINVNATKTATGITVGTALVGLPTTTPLDAVNGVPVGLPIQFPFTISYSDGSSDSNLACVTFSSLGGELGALGAGVNNTTTAAPGTTTVTATVNAGCGGGGLIKATETVIVNAGTLSTITAPTLNIGEGVVSPLTVTGNYLVPSPQSFDISTLVASSSSNAAIATVASGGTGTQVTSKLMLGTTTLTFTLGGVTGMSTVNVSLTGTCVTGIVVAPVAVNPFVKGSTQQFTATASYTNGQPNADVTSLVAWKTSDATKATVSGSGLATSTGSAGVATITATGTPTIGTFPVCAGGVLGSTTVTSFGTVTDSAATIASIAITTSQPGVTTIPIGESETLVVTATLTDGTTNVPVANAACGWTSTAAPDLSVNAAGVVHGIAAIGSATITCTLTASPSIFANLALGVASCLPLSVTICDLVSPGPTPPRSCIGTAPDLTLGTTAQFNATATYTCGSGANPSFDETSTAAWSDLPISAGVTASIGATGILNAGTVAGTASVTAKYNGVTSAAIPVNLVTISSITISAAGLGGLANGFSEPVSITAMDSLGNTITPTGITWNVGNTAVVTVTGSSSGTLTAVGPGTTTFSAQVGAIVSNTLTVTVLATGCINNITLNAGALGPTGVPFFSGVGATCTLSTGPATPCGTLTYTTAGTGVVACGLPNGQFCVGPSGTGTITATSPAGCPGTVSNTQTITVATSTLASLTLSPGAGSIPVNEAQAYTTIGTYGGGSGAGNYNLSALATLHSNNLPVAVPNTPNPSLDVNVLPTVESQAITGSAGITSTFGGLTSNTATLNVNATVVLKSITVYSDASSTALCPAVFTPCQAASASYPVGGWVLQLHAYGTNNDGSSAGDITAGATFNITADTSTSKDSAFLTTGLFETGSKTGAVTVTASKGGVTSAGYVINLDANPITALAIVSPTGGAATTKVPNGGTAYYEVTATTSSGTYWATFQVGIGVLWSESSGGVEGTLGSVGFQGETYHAILGAGTTNLKATLGALTAGPLGLTDTGATVSSLTCAPATASVAKGTLKQLTSSVSYSDGTVIDETLGSGWTTTSGGTTSSIGPTGVVTGIASGSDTATASFSTVNGTCAITVP